MSTLFQIGLEALSLPPRYPPEMLIPAVRRAMKNYPLHCLEVAIVALVLFVNQQHDQPNFPERLHRFLGFLFHQVERVARVHNLPFSEWRKEDET